MALVGRKRGVLPRVAAVLPGKSVEGAGCSFLGHELALIPLPPTPSVSIDMLYQHQYITRQADSIGEVRASRCTARGISAQRLLGLFQCNSSTAHDKVVWYTFLTSFSSHPLPRYTITSTHVNIITRTIHSHASSEDASLAQGSPAAHRALRASH